MPIIYKKNIEMKKFIFGVAMVLGMLLAVSCGCNQTQEATAEEEVVEAVDSVAVADTTAAVVAE